MPDWIAGVANVNVRGTRSVSVKMQYIGGYGYSVQLGNGLLGDADYSLGEISAFREKLGAASNFGVRSFTETNENSVAVANVRAGDDAYGANITMNLRFQNDEQELFTLTVPGPLKRLFAGDSTILVAPDGGEAAGTGPKILDDLIQDTQNLVNNSYVPPNTFTFIGGERAKRAMKPARRPDAITLIEPSDDNTQP